MEIQWARYDHFILSFKLLCTHKDIRKNKGVVIMMIKNNYKKIMQKAWNIIIGVFKAKSSEYIEVELRELENVFALVILGSFIGLPSPPTVISLKLLPHIAKELLTMSRISERLDDMLGEMAGIFEIT